MKDDFCSYCGHDFRLSSKGEDVPLGAFPRTCQNCNKVTYSNPTPVAVIVQPVSFESNEVGVITVRRSIPPEGVLALPGGFIDRGETWQHACARELEEETGTIIDERGVAEFAVRSVASGNVLIFGLAPPIPHEKLPPFKLNGEASERVITKAPMTLAFATHTEILKLYFDRLSPT